MYEMKTKMTASKSMDDIVDECLTKIFFAYVFFVCLFFYSLLRPIFANTKLCKETDIHTYLLLMILYVTSIILPEITTHMYIHVHGTISMY